MHRAPLTHCGQSSIVKRLKTNRTEDLIVIYGIGIDIEEISRVAEVNASQRQFIDKLLTAKEKAVYESLQETRAAAFLAGRWSVKEAYSKALGTGIGKTVGFQDIEVLDDAAGKPVFTTHPFDGKAFVSISHTGQMVAAQVVLERG